MVIRRRLNERDDTLIEISHCHSAVAELLQQGRPLRSPAAKRRLTSSTLPVSAFSQHWRANHRVLAQIATTALHVPLSSTSPPPMPRHRTSTVRDLVYDISKPHLVVQLLAAWDQEAEGTPRQKAHPLPHACTQTLSPTGMHRCRPTLCSALRTDHLGLAT
mmetsp:Transcript_35578/g.76929  ORF Transcript_35578/g.76929 Transcript_35578/m.76929 type:complete len:161 (+) Transcript_35578:324-806(+)